MVRLAEDRAAAAGFADGRRPPAKACGWAPEVGSGTWVCPQITSRKKSTVVWGPCVSGQPSDLQKLRVDLWGDVSQQQQAARTGSCLWSGAALREKHFGQRRRHVSVGRSSVPASCPLRDLGLRPA